MEGVDPKVSPAERGRVPDFVLGFAYSRIAAASLFFAAALLVRLYFLWTHANFDNIFSVRGVPYSDSSMWVWAGIKLAEGQGLGSVYRPGLSFLLSLFYVWFGNSWHLIGAINLFVGAATAALIYLVGERIFSRGIAAAAAVFFVFDPSQLTQMPQATTEPLGLMLFAGSVYCVLVAEEGGKLRLSFFGGALLALSNLTRPLTLFCAPFYVIYLGAIEWLRTRKTTTALLLMALFCGGTALTMMPWLVRQKLVNGVAAPSTNIAEALYAATSPKYKTWKYTVHAEADRDGIAHTVAARYRYFMAESWKNIARYPSFYAGQVSRSYWNFLNSFSYAARSDNKEYEYGQWNGLVDAQLLFLFILIATLGALAMRFWICVGAFAGGVAGCISAILLLIWHCFPLHSGAVIILVGVGLAFARCHRRGVVLLAASLAISGLGDAIFNNAILYRAVMMTDWIVSLFYLAAFCLCSTAMTELAIRHFRKGTTMDAVSPDLSITDSSVLTLEGTLRRIFLVSLIGFGVFAVAGSARLAAVNFGLLASPRAVQLRLSAADKLEIIRRLRQVKPALRPVLPDPGKVAVHFTDSRNTFGEPVIVSHGSSPKAAPSAKEVRNGVAEFVVFQESLPSFLYFFPAQSEFEERNRLFKRRPYRYTVFITSHGRIVFPGKIPQKLTERQVVFVGWIEGVHPNGARYGEVMQCVAIIPVSLTSTLDYREAIVTKSQENLL